ncbi:MAG: hypothetical protein JW990_07920 [Thermoleophilia bacterium]|nr:hypothetical protein [Thermoleophilia bacterium]
MTNFANSPWPSFYSAADGFRHLAPWSAMGEEDVFGVQNPATGEPLCGSAEEF